MPPIHLDCGFYPLSKAARDRGKDEKKNPLESQWQTSLSPTPSGGGRGGDFKKHKTNHKVFFIPTQSWRHKCYLLYCWCSSIPFKHFNTVNDISQDDFIAFCRVETATSNYFFLVWIVPLEDKVSVLLWYLEEKHLNKPFSTLQEGAALLSEFRIQLPKWG